MRICGWSASLVVAVIVSSAGQSPSPPRRLPPQGTIATSSATQPASSVALVSWVTRYSHDGMHALELLVVWRGEPGWVPAQRSAIVLCRRKWEFLPLDESIW
jgi:hypothetical protein